MKNPLNKRFLRELKNDPGKYLVIFLLMVISIGFVSGFLVADGSMIITYNEGFAKYNVEDGHFIARDALDEETIGKIEAEGVKLYPQYFVNRTLDNGNRLRIYADRKEVNLICLMKGALPEAADEIALDRMYAQNNKLKIGDTVTSGEDTWTITGLVAFPDYSCLFEDNNDSMFDSVQFGTAIVSEAGFAALGSKLVNYDYAWLYDEKPASVKEEMDVSAELMKTAARLVTLDDLIPRYANQAINFTGEDMGSDRASMIVFLYIVTVLIAFVFGVTMRSTITKESGVIGTLLASGCTKGEIIRHYMTLPAIVTVISAVVGNILGYTVLKNVCMEMYYNSYSLPTYTTIWSAEAFWMTTVVPLVLMVLVNLFELRKSLRFSPLQFLRHELTRKAKTRAVRLSHAIPFLRRYRLRVLFKNVGGYVVMLIGIFLAYTLLLFGLFFPNALRNYQKDLPDMMFANYQYLLKIPTSMTSGDNYLQSLISGLMLRARLTTDNPDAEAFSAYSLKTTGEHGYMVESVTLYGVEEDSRYIDLDLSGGKVYASSACAAKFNLKPGSALTLKEEYLDDTYDLQIEGIYDYEAGIVLFMSREALNEMFDLGNGFFAGYMSDSEITDIDEQFIGTVIDEDALARISRQLLVSMGSMMYLLDGFALVLFVIIIYLITKMIIDRNTLPISMLKILGSSDREAGMLYIIPSMLVTFAGLLVTIPFVSWLIQWLVVLMLRLMMPGWIPIRIDPIVYGKMVLYGVIAYGLVTLLEIRRIRKIPMDETLKNAE